jgi:predicted ATPase
VLRRLAIFPCQFTLPAACAVAAGSPNGSNVVEDVASLISKSLVIADFSDETARYRLLDTTRTYAFDKLAASGELDATTRRYAEGFPPPAALARRSSPRYQPATPDAASA